MKHAAGCCATLPSPAATDRQEWRGPAQPRPPAPALPPSPVPFGRVIWKSMTEQMRSHSLDPAGPTSPLPAGREERGEGEGGRPAVGRWEGCHAAICPQCPNNTSSPNSFSCLTAAQRASTSAHPCPPAPAAPPGCAPPWRRCAARSSAQGRRPPRTAAPPSAPTLACSQQAGTAGAPQLAGYAFL